MTLLDQMAQILLSDFDAILKLKHLEKYIYFVQKLYLNHNWDKCCYVQFFSILNIVNLIELIEFDVAIACKKNMSGGYFQLRLKKI